MKIHKITYENRNDFFAKYECEHCGHIEEKPGYHDNHFWTKVIPAMHCGECGKNRNGVHGSGTPHVPFEPQGAGEQR